MHDENNHIQPIPHDLDMNRSGLYELGKPGGTFRYIRFPIYLRYYTQEMLDDDVFPDLNYIEERLEQMIDLGREEIIETGKPTPIFKYEDNPTFMRNLEKQLDELNKKYNRIPQYGEYPAQSIEEFCSITTDIITALVEELTEAKERIQALERTIGL